MGTRRERGWEEGGGGRRVGGEGERQRDGKKKNDTMLEEHVHVKVHSSRKSLPILPGGLPYTYTEDIVHRLTGKSGHSYFSIS